MEESFEYFGFLLVDKEKGMTSHDVVHEVRTKLKCKVGHTGTLDPFATGLLILALGKATRLAEFIQKQDKEYEVEMILGEERDSYDVMGALVEKRELGQVTDDAINSVLEKFKGEIEQTPPAFSALKVGGQRAYKLARRGEEVKIPKRKISILKLELVSIDLPSITLRVGCSSGTYIRSLVHEIGIELDTLAYAKELRRLSVGKYSVKDAVTLRQLFDLEAGEIHKRVIKPLDAMQFLPQIELDQEQYEDIIHGREIQVRDLTGIGEIGLAVKDSKLISIVNILPKDDYVTLKPDKVFV